MSKIRKALVAGSLAGLAALTPLLVGDGSHLTRIAIVAALVAGLTGGLTWWIKNEPKEPVV